MKIPPLSILLVVASLCLVQASTRLDADELPTIITHSIGSYFPGAKIIAAERDGDSDDDDREYEVIIKYKDLKFELELSANGKLTDIDITR